MCDDGQRRSLSKVLGKSPVREAYLALLEEHRRSNMTDEEKHAEKKRKAVELKNRRRKRPELTRRLNVPRQSRLYRIQKQDHGASRLRFDSGGSH